MALLVVKRSSSFIWRNPCLLCGRRSSSWSSQAVRSTFVDFFTSHDHKFVPSSSVIPMKGEGTYFTNAGMNQFKPIFLGESPPSSRLSKLTRAANSQKCIRVGGKHNDLEDVGHDLTHHTFFEMLGNWSFGDYFKKQACSLAYLLLTEQYGIPPDRLYFTYFAGDESLGVGADEECKDIWLSLGIPAERVHPFGQRDNFWDMGETGPCGPCTEIHFDHVGGRLSPAEVNTGSPQLVEIWNLVFMQYNRLPDGSLQHLPAKHVDTGMGLERLTALLNGSADNYSTDLFMPSFHRISEMSGAPNYSGELGKLDCAYRILADHVRMVTVAISDGLLPSGDNLGHKLRSILHRCIHLSRQEFGCDPHILFPALVSDVVDSLSCAYPELATNKSKVCEVINASIQHHDKQQEAAVNIFNKVASRTDGNVIKGEVIHALEKGQYGSAVPMELIHELASSRGLRLDMRGYSNINKTAAEHPLSHSPVIKPYDSSAALVKEMLASGVSPTVDSFKYDYYPLNESQYDFSGMETIRCNIQGLSHQGDVTNTLKSGQEGVIVLDQTCFYAEAGGQEGDSGYLTSETGKFVVTNTQNKGGFILHSGSVIDGCLSLGQRVAPSICRERREGCMCNHTATHLLNEALTDLITTTQQQGSSITPYKLTFDFLALNPLPPSFATDVERSVQKMINSELYISRSVLPLKDALAMPNLKTLQNEEYPDTVSMISVGDDGPASISSELCGGTHVCNTSEVEEFCVTQLSTKSQNVKRITCVTYREALQALHSGKVLHMIVAVLQKMNLYEANIGDEWEAVTAAALELQSLLESRRERLEHSQTCLPDCDQYQHIRLKGMLEDLHKSMLWVDSVLAINKTGEVASSVIPILRALISILRKGKDLDLMQKFARDEAEACLNKIEHKITEVINQTMIRDLQQSIEISVLRGGEEDSFGFIVASEFAPRQLTKVFRRDWKALGKAREITLVHFSKKNITVVCAVNTNQNSETGFSEMLNKLKQVAPTKGKQLAGQGSETVSLYSFTVNTRTQKGETVTSDDIKACIAATWVEAVDS